MNGTQLIRSNSKPESPFVSRSLSMEADRAIQQLEQDSKATNEQTPKEESANGEVNYQSDSRKPILPWLSIRTSSAFTQQQTPQEAQNGSDNKVLMQVISKEGLVLQDVLPNNSRDFLGYTMNAQAAGNAVVDAYMVPAKSTSYVQQGKSNRTINNSKEEDDLEAMKESILATLNQRNLNRENSDGPSISMKEVASGDSNAFDLVNKELVRKISNKIPENQQDPSPPLKSELPQKETDSDIVRQIQKDQPRRMLWDRRPLWRMQSSKEGSKQQVPVVDKKSPYRPGISFDIDWENDITFHERGFLGEGSFGKVYRGVWQGHEVVAKIFKPEFQGEVDKRTQKIFETELEIMCRAQHDNIVACYGGCKRSEKRAVVMEYMDRGSLDTYIHKKRQALKLIHYFKIIKSVAKALNYLHPTIVHLDIKPQNILLNSQGMVKVADFGLSRFKETSVLSSSCNVGTAQYIAPEMLTGNHKPTFKLDIYALGVLMWEMYTGARPWDGYLECQIAYQVMQGERPSIPSDCPEGIRDMMTQCWDSDPKLRPSANEIYVWCKQMIQAEEKREKPIILHRTNKQTSDKER